MTQRIDYPPHIERLPPADRLGDVQLPQLFRSLGARSWLDVVQVGTLAVVLAYSLLYGKGGRR